MSRARWLLRLLIWLLAGAGLGLYLGWVVFPVKYVDTAPASLQQAYKDDYLLMVASAYTSDGDLLRARASLETLGFTDPGPAVAAAAARLSAAGYPSSDLERLAALADALNNPQSLISALQSPL